MNHNATGVDDAGVQLGRRDGVLLQGGGTLPQQRAMAVHSGSVTNIAGWLGAFEVGWTQAADVLRLLESPELLGTGTHRDLAGVERAVLLKRP